MLTQWNSCITERVWSMIQLHMLRTVMYIHIHNSTIIITCIHCLAQMTHRANFCNELLPFLCHCPDVRIDLEVGNHLHHQTHLTVHRQWHSVKFQQGAVTCGWIMQDYTLDRDNFILREPHSMKKGESKFWLDSHDHTPTQMCTKTHHMTDFVQRSGGATRS